MSHGTEDSGEGMIPPCDPARRGRQGRGRFDALFALWMILGAAFAGIDFLTGPFVQFPFFFLLPIALAAWHSGRVAGILLAVILPLVRPVYFLEFWDAGLGAATVALNAAIRILVFALFAELIHRVASASRFREQVLACLPVGLWVADRQGNIVQGNAAGTAIWGGEPFQGAVEDSCVPMWWHHTGRPVDPREWALFRAVHRGETVLDQAIDIRAADGSRKTILHSATPMRDDKGRVTGALLINQDISGSKRLEAEKRNLADSLEEALKDIKVLKGLLPVCANCKKIRDEEGSWRQMEEYIRSHSEAEFSHGICPECLHRHYPEFAG